MILKGVKKMKIKRTIAAVMALVLVGGAYPLTAGNAEIISKAAAASEIEGISEGSAQFSVVISTFLIEITMGSRLLKISFSTLN